MFQRIVLTVAIIILIITLAIMGLLMFNNHSAVQWPPEVSSCPDYFTASAPNVCQNTEKITVANTNCPKPMPKNSAKCEHLSPCGNNFYIILLFARLGLINAFSKIFKNASLF